MTWFGIGLAMLSLLIGYLCGFTQSPIVATIVPLLFAIITAAAAWFAPQDEAKPGRTASQVRAKLRLFGVLMVVFSPAFFVGLWGGVAAKTWPFMMWPKGNDDSVVAETHPSDPRILAAQLRMEEMLIRANVDKGTRLRLFNDLADASEKRRAASSVLDSKVEGLLADWHKSKLSNNLGKLKDSADRLKPIAEGTTDAAAKQSIEGVIAYLDSLTATSALADLDRLAGLLESIRISNKDPKANAGSLASEDEVAAWKEAVDKSGDFSFGSSLGRKIASEEKNRKDDDRMPG